MISFGQELKYDGQQIKDGVSEEKQMYFTEKDAQSPTRAVWTNKLKVPLRNRSGFRRRSLNSQDTKSSASPESHNRRSSNTAITGSTIDTMRLGNKRLSVGEFVSSKIYC